MLESTGLTSDTSQADLTSQAEDGGIMGIMSSDDLQLAVGWHCRRGKDWIQINILTQDDWGQRNSEALAM